MKRDIVYRKKYADAIRPLIGMENIKVLTGIRRSGKSSMLGMIADEISSEYKKCNIIYVDMEQYHDPSITNGKELYDSVESRLHGVNDFVFLDEVQEIDGWENAVRALRSKHGCDIYVTGSNSSLLSAEYSTRLAGRYNLLKVYPLTFSECIEFEKYNETFTDKKKTFERFLRVGGFPVLWKTGMDELSAMSTLNDVYSSIVVNDITERYGIRNAEALKRMIAYMCDNIGNITSLNNIYNTLNSDRAMGRRIVDDYSGYLENAMFIKRAEMYDIRGKRILDPKYKFYLSDLGFKHSIFGYRPADTGKHLENIVYAELLSRGYSVHVGEFGGKEIDFVAMKGGVKIYVQVAWKLSSEETVAREFGNLESIEDSNRKYVIMMDPEWGNGSKNGIEYCQIEDFLTADFY